MISVSFVSVLLPLHTLVTTMCGVASKTYRPSAAAQVGRGFLSANYVWPRGRTHVY